jgi:hypothetical protein
VGRSLALIALAFVAALWTAPIWAQGPGEYRSLVERYQTGDDRTAVAALARWSRPDVTNAVHFWTSKLTSRELTAAVMLHTDLANEIIDGAPPLARFHMELAELLVRDVREGVGRSGASQQGPAFVPRWYAVVTSLYTSFGLFPDADRVVRDGLSTFPRDPMLHVARGAIQERRANVDAMDLKGAPSGGVHLVPRVVRPLESAAADFRRALELDNTLALAQLHLGWVHFLLQDNRAARDLDAAAAAQATDDGVRYLAHIFLGAVAERDNRLPDAGREYEAAKAIGPAYQTPFIALSRVEEALGHNARARDIAQEYASLETKVDDPWWDYHLGGVDVAAFSWLRHEAQRR